MGCEVSHIIPVRYICCLLEYIVSFLMYCNVPELSTRTLKTEILTIGTLKLIGQQKCLRRHFDVIQNLLEF